MLEVAKLKNFPAQGPGSQRLPTRQTRYAVISKLSLLSEVDNMGRASLDDQSIGSYGAPQITLRACESRRLEAERTFNSTLSTPPHWPTHHESKSAFCPTTVDINNVACTLLSLDPPQLALYWPDV